jgi:hypothetical protein
VRLSMPNDSAGHQHAQIIDSLGRGTATGYSASCVREIRLAKSMMWRRA